VRGKEIRQAMLSSSATLRLDDLLGLQLFVTSHAADMRGFGFRRPNETQVLSHPEWYLHICCAWRIESSRGIVTGRLIFGKALALMVFKTPEGLGSLNGCGTARRIEQTSGDLPSLNLLRHLAFGFSR